MSETGFYPAGATNDKRAPYNQPELTPVTSEVEYSCVLRRYTSVSTTDYIKGEAYKEWDDDGYSTVIEDNDFSNTDWFTEFTDQHYTPIKLIEILRETAQQLVQGKMPEKRDSFWKNIIAECENWSIEDEDVEI